MGATLIAGLVGLLWLDGHATTPGSWLLGLVLVFALWGAQETLGLFGAGGYRPLAPVIYAGTLLVVASNALWLFWRPVDESQALVRLGWPLAAYTVSVLAALVVEMRRYRQPGGTMVNVALASFGITYVGLLASFVPQLRALGGADQGMIALAALILTVKMGDTGAYTVGRLIGRHKMAPTISPGKTLEGAGGAIAFACLGAWFAFHVLPLWMHCQLTQRSGSWLVFGIVVGGAGLLGDLGESLFKRDMGAKDSSTWLPGFGGVLDLLDSILFAAPVAYLCWLLGME